MDTLHLFGVVLLTVTCTHKIGAITGPPGQRDLSEFVGWDDYKAAWEQDLQRSRYMYPFMERFGDTTTYSPGVSLPLSVPFYAVKYKSLYISKDGFIRFSTQDTAPPSVFHRELLPNQLYPEPRQEDPAIAAIFYAPQNFETKGVLNYRVLRRSNGATTKERVDTGQLDQLSEDVRNAVVGADDFLATSGIIVTWENVTFQGVNIRPGQRDVFPVNTYQMVLVTNDVDTYVIMNFYNITWAGSSSMGCDPETGRESDSSPNCRGPQIGFNVGEGRHFWSMAYSESLQVVDLDLVELKGSDVRGRFYFKVSDAFIIRGGCTDDLKIAGPNWPLATNPTSGGMFGGYDVNISAPCFGSGDRITCRFGNILTDGVYDGNVMKARCPAPMMTSVGPLNVSVSTDGGIGYPFSTLITIGMMGYSRAGVRVQNPGNDWLNVYKFDLNWDPLELTWRRVDFVDIRLFGYRESATTGSGTWRFLRSLARKSLNSGYFTVNTASHQCGEGMDAQTDCTQYAIGLIQVTIADTDPASSPIALLSEPIPLGWFIRTAAANYMGSAWAHEMCRHWHSDDIKHDQWHIGLPVCPCTLGQAYVDWGRFPVDIHCNQANKGNPDNCRRHKGAVHCVISTHYTVKGAGSHCCYDNSGDLMYSGDTQYGSAPDKAHPWGMPPYGNTPHVPTLSNWFWDMAPFYTCCEWQDSDYDCFNLYISRRTTPSCQPYTPPALGAVFGDPHMRTFDGAVYTYNAKGEFWLLLVDQVTVRGQQLSFALQGRFQQPKQMSWGTPKATTMTSVAMQETRASVGRGDTVEIQRNNYAPYDRLLLVYVNRRLLDFRNIWRQDFPEFIIINNDLPTEKVHGNFTIVFRASGVGVQVASKNGLIHVITVVPPEFKGLTEGLLGVWDDNPDNDIQPRGGGQFVPPDDTKRIHDLVGYTWQIGESESRFMYWAKLNRDYYMDETFTPAFFPAFPSNWTGGITVDDVLRECGNDIPCQYDYMVTLLPQVAQETLAVQAWSLQQVNQAQKVVTCGWLNIPGAIKRAPLRYTPGSTVYIDGCRSGFNLEGRTQYRCEANGESASWQPSIETQCVDLTQVQEARSQLALAIGVPAGIILLLIIIGILALLCYLRQKRIDRREKENPPDELIHIPRSDFHASDLRQEDMEITKPKKPRPARRPNQSQSQEDLTVPRIPAKPMSASMDELGKVNDISYSSSGKDTIDLNSTLQSGTSSQKPHRPYHYPRNTDTLQEKKRAPYPYQQTRDDFTPDERALIEARARQYNV